jgi:hypothetical protein
MGTKVLWRLWLFGVSSLCASAAAHATLHIRICNRGDVPVSVALATDKGLIHDIEVSGWERIDPGNGLFGAATNSCPVTFSVDDYGSYALAFAIRRADGRKGIIELSGESSGAVQDIQWNLCVDPKNRFKRRGGRTEMQNCRANEVLVPFSKQVRIRNPSSARNFDVTLLVRPTSSSTLAVEFDRPKSAADASRARPGQPASPAPAQPVVPDKPRVEPTFYSMDWSRQPADVKEVAAKGTDASHCFAYVYVQQFLPGRFINPEWRSLEGTILWLNVKHYEATGTTEGREVATRQAERVLRELRDQHRRGRYPPAERIALCEYWAKAVHGAFKLKPNPALSSADPPTLRKALLTTYLIKQPRSEDVAFYTEGLRANRIDAAINKAIDAWARESYPFRYPFF